MYPDACYYIAHTLMVTSRDLTMVKMFGQRGDDALLNHRLTVLPPMTPATHPWRSSLASAIDAPFAQHHIDAFRNRCGACHKVRAFVGTRPLKLCARCQRVAYCNATCQKSDWKAHKKSCNK